MGKFAVMTLKHSDKSSYDGSENDGFLHKTTTAFRRWIADRHIKILQRFNIGSSSGNWGT